MEPSQLDTLAIIGLIIILAYLGSKVVQRIGVRQVVGFILVGTLLGSSLLTSSPLPWCTNWTLSPRSLWASSALTWARTCV